MKAYFISALVIFTLLFFSTSPAAACNYSILNVTSWTIAPRDDRTNILSTEYVYTGDRPIRMIDAMVIFKDVLGGSIASFALDRDLRLNSGEAFSNSKLWGPSTFERLLDLVYEDVVVTVCVKGLVFADGEVRKF